MADIEGNASFSKNRKSISPSFEKKSNSEKSRCRKVRKRKRPPSDDDIDLESEKESEIDISLERKLRECAKRNNLSPLEVKKLLRKIVGNDHVLALVKLQEEELNKNESLSTPSKNGNSTPSKDDKSIDSTPKLTRAKAKALNKKPVSLPSLNEIEPEPEVTALITEEMNTDDEDDEYEPKEEDYVYSEDDFNTTTSDLDSQPRTPLANISYCSEAESPNKFQSTSQKYSSDGVFKIPRERTTSGLTKEDEIIAKRTRSKLCLQTTSIEAIESNFMPPDITRDMYEIDNEIDQEWAQFLNEFSKPLNHTANAEEDDPEDPEYVAADKIPIDAEELKEVNISKKELSDLVAELFDGLIQEGVFLEDIPELETPRKISDEVIVQRSVTKSPQKKKSKFCIKSQPIFTSPTYEHFSDNNLDMANEPVRSENLITVSSNTTGVVSQNCQEVNEHLINNQNDSVFSPNVMSTPFINTQTARTIRATQELSQAKVVDYSYINSQSNYTPMRSSTTLVNCISPNARVCPYENNENYSSRVISSYSIEPQSVNNEIIGSHQRVVTLIAYPANGGPPCYKKVPISSLSLINPKNNNFCNESPIIATLNANTTTFSDIVDLTSDFTCIPQPKLYGSSFRTKSGFISHTELFEMWKGDAHKSAEKYYKMFYERKYNTTLNNIRFATLTNNYDSTQIGFTSDQKKLFEQQLRIHVQILTQNYLQTYSHPQFWQKAKSQKDLLLDLESKCSLNENSAFNAWNLKNAIKLINCWEVELSEENEENQNFMDFVHHQIERIELNRRPRSHRIIKFPPKTMKLVLKSNVFLYPEFLPRLPFVSSSHADYHDLAPVESHLLAFELEKYLPGVLDLLKNAHKKTSAVKLACDKISNEIMTGKSGRRLYDFYKQELESDNYNPIKYFNERGKAPPFEHLIKPFDPNCILPPIAKKQQLPMLWKEFATELDASENKNDIKQKGNNNFTNEIVWAKTKQDLKLRRKERKDQKRERKKEKERSRELKNKKPNGQNVIINLNYVLENPSKYDNNGERIFQPNNMQNNNNNNNGSTALVTKMERRTSTTDYSQVFTKIHEPLDLKFGDDASYLNHLNVQYPLKNNVENSNPVQVHEFTNNEIIENIEPENDFTIDNSVKDKSTDQKRLTDYFSLAPNKNETTKSSESIAYNSNVRKIFISEKTLQSQISVPTHEQKEKRLLKLFKLQNKGLKFSLRRSRYGFRSFRIIKRLKDRKCLRNKLQNLLLRYWKYLYQMCNKYKNIFLKKCFIHFKKIEIYSDFLENLKILCHNTCLPNSTQFKVSRIENGESSSDTISTFGESLVQILMPKNFDISKESESIINSKNFFEKVEEKFCNSGKGLKFKKFLSILKNFNPENNSILWFYNKMEKIFLPDHIDLAQIFLHFLLPVEASEASNFFRNYMISNSENFAENLNRYFEKYEEVIPKIYDCLMELDQQNLELQTEDIKIKLLSLINRDKFLEEWLKQIFVEENLEENSNIRSSQTSITFKVSDLISNLSELQPSELKYIDARSTSISKVLLPGYLCSLANSLLNNKTIAVISLDDSQLNKNNIERARNIVENNVVIDNKKSEEECKFKNIKDLIENISLDSENNNDNKSTSQNFNNRANDGSERSSLNENENLAECEENFLVNEDNSTKSLFDEPVHQNLNENGNKIEEISHDLREDLNFSNEEIRCKNSRKNEAIHKSKEIIKTELKKDKTANEKIFKKNKSNDDNGIKQSSDCTDVEPSDENLIKNKKPSVLEWSRDEDRTILEEASLNFETNENLIKSISEKLPNRNLIEINDRYSFLINLLSQLKNKERSNNLLFIKFSCTQNKSAEKKYFFLEKNLRQNITVSFFNMSLKKTKLEGDCLDPNTALPIKKSKHDEDAARLKKANRLKENLRHMLLADNPDDQDIKKKNAIYAYNFFEKVEETFVNSGKEHKFKKFVSILKSFDPENDNAVGLYQKLEKLFLPNHPDLIEIFLTFLQPTEAYQAGKFFEHFIVTNMSTFINKLNIYFNKQPAQIRKIYNCLNELSEDNDLTLDKIKSKILPLLKGNQYLIDWFLQVFPSEKPPESILQINETVNLKEIDSNQNGIIYETLQLKDLIDDFPTDVQSCQLKYFNGRIFYGSRLLLPAKLSFMAEHANDELDKSSIYNEPLSKMKCVHDIRQLGEEYLRVKDSYTNSSENEKSEDDDQIKEHPKYEFCDEATLRMHAVRLNPSLYATENFTGHFYKANRSEDGKCSPKKQFARTTTMSCPNNKDKYKSPKKNFLKSPLSVPNNLIKKPLNNESNVFATARKLKALCEEEINENQLEESNKVRKRKIQKTKLKNQDSGSENQPESNESECETENSENTSICDIQQTQQQWTREEDKIILEEVKLGFELHEELMNRIAKKLTGRLENEINIRYQFLMDVLSQLQKKN
ncbi:uncharacterized protein LOC129607773 [Condylostylus longicornis]|uniref:uncharacterized protein LOC129607773 n=1 Tax=Condylostylus longicornis TaxID=2530218 RepID=UPI00244DB639|nr:uncharacterized protein LOC129607773 [Condylostylus longicornis]